MRQILAKEQLSEKALNRMNSFHADVVADVQKAIREEKVVVVGMAQNPFVKKARNLLTEKNMKFKYIEHGSYFSQWRQRLAIKLWSGWPTFPQVFVDGRLIGGHDELVEFLANLKN